MRQHRQFDRPVTLKERVMIACLQGLLANPDVTTIGGVRNRDPHWREMLAEVAEELADELLLRMPTDGMVESRRVGNGVASIRRV